MGAARKFVLMRQTREGVGESTEPRRKHEPPRQRGGILAVCEVGEVCAYCMNPLPKAKGVARGSLKDGAGGVEHSHEWHSFYRGAESAVVRRSLPIFDVKTVSRAA